jgi:energy-coupling factor transport system substrate-specific component
MCLLALMGALMVGAQAAMAPLPNIEPVSLLLICCTLVFGGYALYACYTFVLLEGLLYGFGLWFFNYLYVWAILVGLVLLLRKNTSPLFWAVISGIFGLCFGALCAIPYFMIGGWQSGVAYWISGIPYDLLHAVGNAVLAAVLVRPLTKLLFRLAAGHERIP